MITIIAEKPSVARQISRVVGAMERKVGYYGGNNYCVTWAFGHLIQLAMPEAYGITGFRRESLPIIPDEFQLISRKDAKGNEDAGVKEQLKVIKNLFEHMSPCPLLWLLLRSSYCRRIDALLSALASPRVKETPTDYTLSLLPIS